MDIFDHCASQHFQRVALLHSSGPGLCYWILLCASRVYKSKKFLLASNVSLVESESCATLIPLVGELMDSKVISSFFLNVGLYFFTAKLCIPEIPKERFAKRTRDVCLMTHINSHWFSRTCTTNTSRIWSARQLDSIICMFQL